MLAFDVPPQVILGGATRGLAIGVFAVGIILIFRSNRVINFALGELGAFCAAVFVRLTVNYHWNFYPALALAGAVGLLAGGLLELALVPRLGKAPKVILMVATIGAAQLLLFLQSVLPDISSYDRFPTAFTKQWTVGSVVIRAEHVVALVVLPLIVIGLAWFLNRTKHGTSVRAAADNPDAARLAGISVKRVSFVVWTLAGGLAAVTTILSAPLANANVSSTGQIGPGILMRTLAVAVIAGMASMPVALGAGIVLGIVEAVVFYNNPTDPGRIDALIFLVVLVAVLVVSARNRSLGVRERFSFAPRVRPIPESLRGSWLIRNHSKILATLALVIAAVVPLLVTSQSRQFLYSQILLTALIALSLTVLTGWAGQLSLGQFALVGLGGVTAYSLYMGRLQFPIAVAVGAVVAAIAAVVVGLPALRMRGLFLAVTTLALAVAAPWILERPVFKTNGLSTAVMPRPVIGGLSLAPERTYYWVCLAVLALAIIAVARLRRSGLGRVLLAVRDNEMAASAMGLSPTRVKLFAFAVSGGLAGLAGGLLVGLLQQFTTDQFSATQSLQVVAVAVVGGIASITGAVLGALLIVGLPAFFPNSAQVTLLTSGVGMLILLLYFPGGLVQILYSLRDVVFSAIASRRTEAAAAPVPAPAKPALPSTLPPRAPIDPELATVLRTNAVSVRFGLRMVLLEASIDVGRGEVVGLIGANGAGKSTLMNAIGGYVPSQGQVELLGQDVTGAPAHRRAALGLGRTFQDAALYGDLTVRETVAVAVETRAKARLLPVVLSLPRAGRAERAKQAHADEILDFLGLGAYAERFVSELSTGMRRIVELACLLASDAKVLCLDEPTAGVAQREAEAFGPLLLQVRQELDASMLVIEHDMPLVMSISDRIFCLEAGRVISSGRPEQVREDPLVIASYLGTDVEAIERSGPRSRAGATETAAT
ncbi:MAG: ATP-binding cassette domain-containing protein [Acidimicrobiia bacterium]|nr:ATP-binding cassette domain-containing protein [Acidimicrobiia bacterium]